MQVWREPDEVPPGTRSVATIGIFDGVHLGHRTVLGATVSAARQHDVPAVVLTFDPHPATVHRPEDSPVLLSGVTDRLELLAALGIDAVLLLTYTTELARLSPEEFVSRYFVDVLGVTAVVIGSDSRFGRHNAGDRHTMVDLGREHGFEVHVVPDVADVAQRRWSSSWARELIEAGQVEKAAAILGRPHRMRGVVVRGKQRGREMGFPTANLATEASGTIPADGVYAGWLVRGNGSRLPAAISVGTNPTFDGRRRTVEAHALWRTDLELYDEEIVVEFTHHLRPTVRYEGVPQLVAQMTQDVALAGNVLGVTNDPQATTPDLLG